MVIDGLDECQPDERQILLDFISQLSSEKQSILVISRNELDIRLELKEFPTISLQDENQNLKRDMELVIEKEFMDTKKWGPRFQSMRDEIKSKLIVGSGMNM